jgi:hypothetical protein
MEPQNQGVRRSSTIGFPRASAARFDRAPSGGWPTVPPDVARREWLSRRRRLVNTVVIACSSVVVVAAIGVCYALLSQ